MSDATPNCVDGRWWEDRWWEKPEYQLQGPAAEKIAAAVDFLREYLPASWVKSKLDNDDFHPIIGYLCWERGAKTQHFLVGTARMIRALRDTPGFQEKLSAFKGEKHFGVSLELHIAELLVEEGMRVEFPAEGMTKTPDIVARRSEETVAIECKRLQRDARDEWQSYLMGQISQLMPSSIQDTEITQGRQGLSDESPLTILRPSSRSDFRSFLPMATLCATRWIRWDWRRRCERRG